MDKNELQTMSSEVSSTNKIIRMLTQDILSIKSFKKIFKVTEFSSIPLVALQEKDIDVNDLITRINVLKNERNLVLLDVTTRPPQSSFIG
jgi:hypothetical protein